MSFLPIVGRELRVAARRPATHWVRFFVTLAVLLIWLAIIAGAGRHASPDELGQALMIAVGILCLGFTMLAGVFYTADCLSVEKREGTLGLLFLTDLRGFDVVLGKLAATSTHGIYGLLTVFPLMAVPFLLGGVSGVEFARQVAVLLVTLFFSLSLGMLVSALSRESTAAMVTALVMMVVLAGLLPALSGLLDELHWIRFQNNPLNWFSPCWAYALAFDGNFTRAGHGLGYAGSLGTLLGVGLVSMVLACWLLPRKWQMADSRWQMADGAKAVPNSQLPSPISQLPTPNSHLPSPLPQEGEGHSTVSAAKGFAVSRLKAATHRFRQAALLSEKPFLWLAGRETRGRAFTRWAYVILVLLWLVIVVWALADNARDFGFGFGVFGAYVLHVVFKCLVAVEATRQFSEDRNSGAMEQLLVTPLPVRSILEGQSSALRRRFFWTGLLTFLMNAFLLWLVLGPNPVLARNERDIFVCILVGGMVVLFLDFQALSWVGAVAGLKHRRHHWAVFATVGKVMVPKWVALFLFIFLPIVGTGLLGTDTLMAVITLWLLMGGMFSLVIGLLARINLRSSFRALASGEVIRRPQAPGDDGIEKVRLAS